MPHQAALLVAIAVTGADVTGIDPAFNRTGITFDSILGMLSSAAMALSSQTRRQTPQLVHQ